MSAELKQFLYRWCRRQKTTLNYKCRSVGSVERQTRRMECQVGDSIQDVFVAHSHFLAVVLDDVA